MFVPLPFECKSILVALEDKQKTAFAKYNQIACNLFDYAFQAQPAAYQNDNLYFTSYFSWLIFHFVTVQSGRDCHRG